MCEDVRRFRSSRPNKAFILSMCWVLAIWIIIFLIPLSIRFYIGEFLCANNNRVFYEFGVNNLSIYEINSSRADFIRAIKNIRWRLNADFALIMWYVFKVIATIFFQFWVLWKTRLHWTKLYWEIWLLEPLRNPINLSCKTLEFIIYLRFYGYDANEYGYTHNIYSWKFLYTR